MIRKNAEAVKNEAIGSTRLWQKAIQNGDNMGFESILDIKEPNKGVTRPAFFSA